MLNCEKHGDTVTIHFTLERQKPTQVYRNQFCPVGLGRLAPGDMSDACSLEISRTVEKLGRLVENELFNVSSTV